MTEAPDGQPPIIVRRSKLACENTRFSVYFDHIVDARTGSEVENYLVVKPHDCDGDLLGGVSVLPIVDGTIVLQRFYRYAIGRWTLEVPRGFIDKGESPLRAAVRELEEEVGLTCAPEQLVPLGFCAPEGGVLAGRLALFAAVGCRPVGHGPDHGEIGLGTAVTLRLDEARALMTAMRLEDPSTALALHRYFLLA